MKLEIYRSIAGDLLFKRQFKNLKEKVKKQEIIIVQFKWDIHVINIKNIINNELINNGIKKLILNNKIILENNINTLNLLEIIYRILN